MKNSNRQRVVITGMGAITPLGLTVDTYWDNLKGGHSGIGPITQFDATEFTCQIAGEIKGFDIGNYVSVKEGRRMARFSQLAVAAAFDALQDAHLDLSKEDPYRTGIILGNGIGGLPTTEDNARILVDRGGMKISPFFIPMILPNMAAGNVSRLLGLKGFTSTVITACAASNQAIGEASEAVRRGMADVIFTGGAEAGISALGLGGFCAIRAVSTRNDEPQKASRPFDKDRDGFVASEGSAMLVLESLEHAISRGATILAEVAGYGVTSDAYHPVEPAADGMGAAMAIRFALENAGLEPRDVDYINAHGTSTPKNDVMETTAIKTVFEDYAYQIPISSTKSMTGHALGGAGALEAVACVKTIQEGIIHPTINYTTLDPECDLDYVPNVARSADVSTVLSNGFGFGGQNASIVLRKYEE